MDCGPTCLKMVAKYHGLDTSIEALRERCHITNSGVTMLDIADAARAIGFTATGLTLEYQSLTERITSPCILHWRQKHFVVLYEMRDEVATIADPATGLFKLGKKDFIANWIGHQPADGASAKGTLLTLEPAFDSHVEATRAKSFEWNFLLHYVRRYRGLIFQLVWIMLAATILQIIVPFLAQAIVDIAIESKDLSFLLLILIAQLVIFISQSSVGIIRGWVLLHLNTRINVRLIADFLRKLCHLPISYFDNKLTGDLLQRIHDHKRIENFLTGSTLSTLFSLLNFIVFSFVLLYYSRMIFLLFCLGSVIYGAWIWGFLQKRKTLDYLNFGIMAENQSSLIQLINGMQEIKLNNSEHKMIGQWEEIQRRLFGVHIKNLKLNQTQSNGAAFVNELKNICLSYIAARSVITGQLSLGMLVAIQYIIGQLNAPIAQLIGFVQTSQDAMISISRLKEIHGINPSLPPAANPVPHIHDIAFQQVNFGYEGPKGKLVLKSIDVHIPAGKITAIVGKSGSGKTTMLKMLLKYYQPLSGQICIGGENLQSIDTAAFRSKIGVVMQEGFIFSDTIANNIALSEEAIDQCRVQEAAETANIHEEIMGMSKQYHTKIGMEGVGISQGQKQRILIARAAYKRCDFIFFDEATNSLDTENERIIRRNLRHVFKNKTVIIIAHRLSTVLQADQILVLERGHVVEQGDHKSLTRQRGKYYQLVKNQLELDGRDEERSVQTPLDDSSSV